MCLVDTIHCQTTKFLIEWPAFLIEGLQGFTWINSNSTGVGILDTLAELVYLRGDQEEAVALIRQAIEQEPESEFYKEQLVKFAREPEGAM